VFLISNIVFLMVLYTDKWMLGSCQGVQHLLKFSKVLFGGC